MTQGIQKHPEWFPNLSANSSFDDFQVVFYENPLSRAECPPPCKRETGAVVVTKETEKEGACPACAPRSLDKPDVVIPFYERDLCKVGYTTQSIAVHDPNKVLGRIILMWVSLQPSSAFRDQIDKVMSNLGDTHETVLLDFSQQVIEGHAAGWFAQQVFKLKVSSHVKSDYYIVMDSKNTIIRDIEEDTFFTQCNQGVIFGEFHAEEIPLPHSDWYKASARVLGATPPLESDSKGKWPSSITPMVIHTQTVLDMLSKLGESSSTDNLCDGPLCDMFGAHGNGQDMATEFTMYVLAVRAREDFDCVMSVLDIDDGAPPAISLWRGNDASMAEQMSVNLDNCREIADGKVWPFMFGAQFGALDGMMAEQKGPAEASILTIYTRAGLHDNSTTSTRALLDCVAGDAYGRVGPVHDKKQQKQTDSQPHDQRKQDEKIHDTAQPKTSASNGSSKKVGGPAPPGEDSYCCTAAQDEGDMCGTCWTTARGGPDSYCGSSEDHCNSCNGIWCSGGPREAATTTASGDSAEQEVASKNASKQTAKVNITAHSNTSVNSTASNSSGNESDGEDAVNYITISDAGGSAESDARAGDARDEDSSVLGPKGADESSQGGVQPLRLCADSGCRPYEPSAACQCNDVCRQYHNCCLDKEDVCPTVVQAVMRRSDERSAGSLRKEARGNSTTTYLTSAATQIVATLFAAALVLALAARAWSARVRGPRAALVLLATYQQIR